MPWARQLGFGALELGDPTPYDSVRLGAVATTSAAVPSASPT
jgi:hypothetical protein